jgi:hypothetical protein
MTRIFDLLCVKPGVHSTLLIVLWVRALELAHFANLKWPT